MPKTPSTEKIAKPEPTPSILRTDHALATSDEIEFRKVKMEEQKTQLANDAQVRLMRWTIFWAFMIVLILLLVYIGYLLLSGQFEQVSKALSLNVSTLIVAIIGALSFLLKGTAAEKDKP